MTTKGTDNRFRSLTVVGESGAPSTPASGDFKLYVADDGTFYVMDDTGTPTALGGGGFSDPMTTRGDIIVRNASNVTARLAIGSAGKVLSSDGTDVSWQTPSSGGSLVLLEQHTASGSATLDFTSFISSTYDEYLFEVINILPATNDVALRMRMGTGGGPTYDTGTNYGWNVHIARAGTAVTNGADTGEAYIQWAYQTGGTIGTSNSANHNGVIGSCRLFDPQGSTYKSILGHFRYRDAEPHMLSGTVHGIYLSTTAVTAVRFYFASGDIASGTIRVYGVAK